jgi:hypothetical protein
MVACVGYEKMVAHHGESVGPLEHIRRISPYFVDFAKIPVINDEGPPVRIEHCNIPAKPAMHRRNRSRVEEIVPIRSIVLRENVSIHVKLKELSVAERGYIDGVVDDGNAMRKGNFRLSVVDRKGVEAGQSEVPLAPKKELHTDTPQGKSENTGQIDNKVLAIGRPKRRRDKAHLIFVASQACLLCGRQPSDAHHLRFAQPRSMGMKVGDEFTVPLCRIHHRQVHQTGKEAEWWNDLDIDAVEIAKGLWEQSMAKRNNRAAEQKSK